MSEDKFTFAFEHFQAELRPRTLYRVRIRLAIDENKAMVVTRYFDSKEALDQQVAKCKQNPSRTILSVDHYVAV